jgi:hypothetical protein
MQFTLQTLLLVFVVLWSSLAVFGGAGIAVFITVLAMASILNGQTPNHGCVIVPVLVFAMLIALLAPAVRDAREAARGSGCRGRLCQLHLALSNYAQSYGCFPPACIFDKNGRPMHSWRVLILPFMEEQTLYKQYNFNEPWDGPNNKKLLARRPSSFTCFSDDASAQDGVTTNFVAVVGKNAFWEPDRPRGAEELGDQASSTAMLVEVADSGINWTEPRDFCLDDLRADGTTSSAVKLSTRHFRSASRFFFQDLTLLGSYVGFMEGSSEYFPVSAVGPNKLKNWFSVGGYNRAEIHAFQDKGSPSINWTNCAALVVWIASVGLLLYRARRSRKVRESQAETGNSTGSC